MPFSHEKRPGQDRTARHNPDASPAARSASAAKKSEGAPFQPSSGRNHVPPANATSRHGAPSPKTHGAPRSGRADHEGGTVLGFRGRGSAPAYRNDNDSYGDRDNYGSSRSQGGRGAPRSGQGGPQGGMRKSRLVKQVIPAQRFIKPAKPVNVAAAYVPKHRFEDFNVNQKIRANILAKGYETPTPIQDQTIMVALEGRDVVGIANTGTGKTAAFAIPVLDRLMKRPESRCLILAPTRELAQQILEEFVTFAKGSGIRGALLIGGASMHLQKRDLRANPQVIIGSPGRVKDHVDQGTLRLGGFDTLVLDEVDRMLDMGFINDIRSLLSRVAPVRQSFFFSATMEPKIAQLIEGFAKDPVTVSVKEGETTDNVDQNVVWFKESSEKIELLHEKLISESDGNGKFIIFDDTKHGVEKLAKELHGRGFKVDRIHGNKSQAQRTKALKSFKDGSINILVATDVAARGIDVSGITHVINFSQPVTFEDYVHRIGRAGRAGRTGVALTFMQK